MSDAFLDSLVRDLRPVRGAAVPRRLTVAIVAGGGVSLALVLAVLGPRHDLLAALATPALWLKLAYVGTMAAIALWALAPLTRAGHRMGLRLAVLALPIAGVAAWAMIEFSRTPDALREQTAMGRTALLCPFLILIASSPILAGLGWAIRALAPVRLRLTGAIAGLAAGAIGATVYAAHCPEMAGLFVAIWYSLGIALTGLTGALLGPRLLRW